MVMQLRPTADEQVLWISWTEIMLYREVAWVVVKALHQLCVTLYSMRSLILSHHEDLRTVVIWMWHACILSVKSLTV